MDEIIAKKLVKDTLEDSFNKEKFIYLIKNILNEYDENKTFNYRGDTISEKFQKHIKTMEKIGQYIDPKDEIIDILIVKLKKEGALEKMRSIQKDYISGYLDGIRGNIQKAGALVAFVTPDDWRFSFVKMEYDWEVGGKIKKDPTEKSHTTQSLLPLLKKDNVNPTLQEIEDAFSIEMTSLLD